MTNIQLLRAAGLAAVAGGIANAYADYLLQGGLGHRPGLNTYANLADFPFDLVFDGSLIGNAAIPLWLLGFWPVYVALRPAGRAWALPPVLILAYAFSLFPGYHGAYALYASAFQAQAAAPEPVAEVVATMAAQHHAYHDALLDVIGATAPLGFLWLVALILSGRTVYPRWMVLISPVVAPLTQPLIEMLPAPIGGFIRPAWGTTLYTVFFLVTTILVWNADLGDERATASADGDA